MHGINVLAKAIPTFVLPSAIYMQLHKYSQPHGLRSVLCFEISRVSVNSSVFMATNQATSRGRSAPYGDVWKCSQCGIGNGMHVVRQVMDIEK